MEDNNTFTSEVKQSLLTATGLTMNIDTANLSEEDAKKLADYIKWHIPGGAAMTEDSVRGKAAKELTEWVDQELAGEEPAETEQENKSQIEIESKEKEPAPKDDQKDPEQTKGTEDKAEASEKSNEEVKE